MTTMTEPMTFRDICREALDRFHDNDRAWRGIRRRIEEMAPGLLTLPEEVQEIIWEGLRSGAKTNLSDLTHRSNHELKVFSANPCKRDIDAMELVTPAMRVAATKSILDAMVVNGKRLGDLTGKDVAVLGAHARRLKQGWAANEKFWAELGSMVPDDKRVRDCVSNEQVQRIAEKQKEWKA